MKLFYKIFLIVAGIFFNVSLVFASSGGYGLDQVPSDLPRGDISTVAVRIIGYVTGLVGIILLVMLIYGGVMYMTSAGNEDQAGKAKKVLTYAIIGIAIVAFSFLITQFIVNALTGRSDSGDSSGGGSSTSTDSDSSSSSDRTLPNPFDEDAEL